MALSLPPPPPTTHTPPKLHPSRASFSPTTTSRSAFTSLHPSATTKRQMFWPDTSSISKTCGEGCERVSGLETGKGRDVYVGHNSVHAALYSATCTTSPPRPRSRKIKKKKKKKTTHAIVHWSSRPALRQPADRLARWTHGGGQLRESWARHTLHYYNTHMSSLQASSPHLRTPYILTGVTHTNKASGGDDDER
ncbi:hypothetical protein C0Q70_07625 [Pomacea canaliculata]|uniref:Uncharacterized protein n=1 Tax=Pomacea canaliculata TaxID=400727 RepID=A0A2T7PFJ7_POMCA|nr:hypothetical protein C0Q70_07625 [Pomacea canaliculata]